MIVQMATWQDATKTFVSTTRVDSKQARATMDASKSRCHTHEVMIRPRASTGQLYTIPQLVNDRIFHAVTVQLGISSSARPPPMEIALAVRNSAATEPLADGESKELMTT